MLYFLLLLDLLSILSDGEPALFELVSEVRFLVPNLLCLGLPNVPYSDI